MATISVETSAELTSAIKRGGSTIEIRPGNYTLKNLIIGKSDTELVSASDTEIPCIYMAQKHPSAPMLQGYNLDGIHFNRICLDGNFSNQPGQVRGSSSQVLCWLRNGEDIKMQNCIMRNSAIDGLKLTACDDILFENNVISDLGHEGLYAMYGCEKGVVRNNKCKTRTNSFCRLSYGAEDFEIYGNNVYSEIASWSTGPGMELDKGAFKDIDIHDNTIKNLNGSGIWFSADVAGCSNVRIHENIFSNVGNFLNGSGKYNGYSNAGIAGAGMSGMIIEDNVFENIKVGYAVLMAEAKHAISGSYKWTFRNNTLKNCKNGFRVSNARGYISGGGNSFINVGTLKVGVTDNIDVTAGGSTPTPDPDPVENTTDTAEKIKVVVTVSDSSGATGSQTIDLATSAVSPRYVSTTLVTFKLNSNGRYGSKNIEVVMGASTAEAKGATGTDLLVTLDIVRGTQITQHAFVLPTVQGIGTSVIKLKTGDGRYGEGPLNITLKQPINEVTTMGDFKVTINASTEDGRHYETTATAKVTNVVATGNTKKISGYIRLRDVDTGDQLHLPFNGELQKNLF